MFCLKCFFLALPLAAALPQGTPSGSSATFKADLRVDTNRDGKVDLTGTTDTEGKDTWSETSGALFLPGIANTARHCHGPDDNCNDSNTNHLWAPNSMAPIRTVAMPNISDSVTATISISDPVARSKVRIFLDFPEEPTQFTMEDFTSLQALPPPENDRWVYLENDTKIPALKLRQGLILAIDGRDTRRPGTWDGRVSVEFKVTDGTTTSTDKVMLRVAPLLTSHHLQPIEKVFVTKKDIVAPSVGPVEDSIRKNMQKAGIKEPLEYLNVDYTWAQDVMEPAYASIPGPEGPITMRINLAGIPVHVGIGNPGARLLYNDLRGDGVGAVDAAGFKEISKEKNLEAGGNIESIPPYEFNGKKFPAGRIIIGASDARTPQALGFLKAQETQDPITVDTTWLMVGHIDEVLSFLPAKTARGWRVALLDPMMGYQALEKLEKEGHGDVLLTSNPVAQNGSSVPSVRDFLAYEHSKKAATHSAEKMEAALSTLRKETGITDEDVVRIPSVIAPMSALQTWLHARKPGGENDNEFLPLNSAFPSQVNGVPLSDSLFMAAKPWGPVVNGEDVIQKMSKDAYSAAGFEVEFVDDWDLHMASGDLHCYTNTYRTPSPKWW
ncbi:arginine deiminase type-3 [Cordyceps fumosorosea ARSEF 2679]|uniref:Arginine deiminase type-3 n=1 Tax=Cordyceps fumosorosea (strain ARSEF 2679) TaxID=1081104 RepID=A0A168EHX1_CORFA|nr:arginine deiminase type-3 [Cordyceps fumosorosea ARSEF 2679]OAA73827.1 arginine deiminase type-3 [Cordyceps fumosorosea ARSEF 2679]